MKKYILFILICLSFCFSFFLGTNNAKSEYTNHLEAFSKIRENCVKKNGVYDNDMMKNYCENVLKSEKYTLTYEFYLNTYNHGLEQAIDSSYDDNEDDYSSALIIISAIIFILLCLVSLDAFWFTKDYLNKQKITNKNNKEIIKNAICISLVPSIPVVLYALAKAISPFFIVKDLIFSGIDKVILCLLIITISLYAFISSLIGLLANKYTDKKLKSIGMIILVSIVVNIIISMIVYAISMILNDQFVYQVRGIDNLLSIYEPIVLVITLVILAVLSKRFLDKKVSK